jgi:hypothetical protein
MADFALQEHPLRTQLRIYTEADYLQAHLTVIEGESRGRNAALHNVKQRATSVLKKWILAANANLTVQPATGFKKSFPQFWTAQAHAAPTRAGRQ